MTQQLTPETLAELKAQRMSDTAIAERYGISATAVQKMRWAHEIPGYYEIINDINPKELAKMKRSGKTDQQCAEHFGVSKTVIRKLRDQYGIIAPKATNRAGMTKKRAEARYLENIDRAREMYGAGLSYRAIGEKLGIPESTIRTWLRPEFKMSVQNTRKSTNTEDSLRIVYDWIVAYKYEHNGNSPTQREISEGTGHAKGLLNHLLTILDERGKISLPEDNRAGGLVVLGAQWIPPTGWKRPARLRKRQKNSRPRVVDKERMAKAGRLCDCGNKAEWYVDVKLGNATGRSQRTERLPLCSDCAQYEKEQGTNVQQYESSDLPTHPQA